MKCFFALALLVGFSCHAQSIETLWRARGLESFDNIKKLLKDKSELSNCKREIEASFGLLADPKVSSNLIKINKDKKFLTLFLSGEKSSMAQLRFSYKGNSNKPFLIQFLSTSPKWSLNIIPSTGDGSFGISNSKCIYFFVPSDYLHPSVSAVHSTK